MIITPEEFIKRITHYISQECIYHMESYSLSVELITKEILMYINSNGIIILRKKDIRKCDGRIRLLSIFCSCLFYLKILECIKSYGMWWENKAFINILFICLFLFCLCLFRSQ